MLLRESESGGRTLMSDLRNTPTDALRAIAAWEDESHEWCDSTWHTRDHGRPGDFCPECFSDWWATDGTEPSEPASYTMRQMARAALAAAAAVSGEDTDA